MFKVGDIVNIKADHYIGSRKREWFNDSRFGLEVAYVEGRPDSTHLRCYRADKTNKFWINSKFVEKVEQPLFKAGDIIDLTEHGIANYGDYFSNYGEHTDDKFKGLEIKTVRVFSGNPIHSYEVYQKDKQGSWWIDANAVMKTEQPADDYTTWKRNTPIVVAKDGTTIVNRHFSHYSDHRIYFYPAGKTSFSYGKGERSTLWEHKDNVRRATKEELE